VKRVLFCLIAIAALVALSAAPAFAQTVPGTSAPVSDQMLYLMGAGFLVTALTGIVKKIGGATMDSVSAQRSVAVCITFGIFGLSKLMHLAPDLQSNVGAVIAWLVASYGLSTGVYEHTKDVKQALTS
jgi:hypothetical protein